MQTSAAINIATDVVLLLIPLPLLPLMKFNKKQRSEFVPWKRLAWLTWHQLHLR
jgi:hypothetical protein